MLELLFWVYILRIGQAGLDATLTLLIGVVTAGVFRRMVGSVGVRRLFGIGLRGLLIGWLAGMLLPVCALGVIPVARELRRCGVPGGTVLSFVLAAPLLNPISFLYGLTLAEPTVILTFAGVSLLLSTTAGFLWDCWFARDTELAHAAELARLADAEPTPPVGWRRILAVATTAMQELAGRDLLFYLIGLTGTAMLSVVIPFGALQHTMSHADWYSPILMLGLAVPLFSSPLPGMMKIGLMFDHGNSIGAAFVLFAIGIGTSLGTLAWLLVDFGWKRLTLWFLSYMVIVVMVAFAAERFLYDKRKAEADHTHAFDDYSCPFPPGTMEPEKLTFQKLQEKFGPLERPALYGFAVFLIAGVALRSANQRGQLDRWLTPPPAPVMSAGKFDLIIPGPVLGAITIAGLIGFSVMGAYIYYPDRGQCLDQMFAVYADAKVAVNTGKAEEAIRHLELWDQLVRKLEVGTYLRQWHVTSEQSRKAADLREALEEVRDQLLAKKLDEAKDKFKLAEQSYKDCRAAYRGGD